MLFALKKIISAFLMPLSIGFILFFIGLMYSFSKNTTKARFYLVSSFLWLFLVSYSPFSNAIIQPLENQYNSYLNVDKSINYVLVLGSGHTTNDNMSAISSLSNTALKRLTEGIRIYNKLENAKLIVSGYGGSDLTPHAIMAKRAAISLGIKEENILTLEKAKDTKEEAFYAKEILPNNKVILVTSAAHMPRAMRIFQNENINVIPAPTDFLSKDDGKYLSVPSAKELKKTQSAFHEYLGTIWYTISNFI